MLKEERHQKILNEVSLRNRILLTDMAEQLNVSVDTIRRDVTELDKKLMLKSIGLNSLDELINETIPEDIRLQSTLNLDTPMSEYEYLNLSLIHI